VPASVLLNFFMPALAKCNVITLHFPRPASTPNLIQTKPGPTTEATSRVAPPAQVASGKRRLLRPSSARTSPSHRRPRCARDHLSRRFALRR
jgi:hypothetical protein